MVTSSTFANFDITERLSQLQTECCDRSTFLSIYGLDLWSPASEACGLFQAWARRLPQKPTVILSPTKLTAGSSNAFSSRNTICQREMRR